MSTASPSERILVTGAAGFIGAALIDALAEQTDAEIVALDLAVGAQQARSGRPRWVEGRLEDANVRRRILGERFDTVFHLASAPGALAEQDPALSRRVNLEASLDLLEGLARSGARPRFVYASSVAVYGEMTGEPVSAKSPARPSLTYGAHKRMTEIALADFSRRGDVSGVAVRLPGVIARPGPASGFGSAFMSELPRALAAGEPYICPVSPNAAAWWMSARRAARNLIHAAVIAHSGVVLLPALRLSIAEVVAALCELYGEDRRSLVSFEPNPRIEAIFGRYPELATEQAAKLGFDHDGSALDLMKQALSLPSRPLTRMARVAAP
jgi:nucleoside-diphosphate-sugar epimerase